MRNILLCILCLFYSFVNAQKLLTDVNPGNLSSSPLFLEEANNKFFFASGYSANNTYWPTGIWSTDGTEGGTQSLMSMDPGFQRGFNAAVFPSEQRFCVLDNRMIFVSRESNTNWSLYSSDGSRQGTYKFMDFGDSVFQLHLGHFKPVIIEGSFIFSTTTRNGNVYIWKSDGTSTGTRIVKKLFSYIFWGQTVGMPYSYTYYNNAAYFVSLADTNTLALWKTNGAIGTVDLIASFPRPSMSIGFPIQVYKNKMYFSIPGTFGNLPEVWISDGTVSGTKPLKDNDAGPSLKQFGMLTEVGSRAFFISQSSQHGAELWITDGTVSGTRLVKDVLPGVNSGASTIIGKNSSKVFFLGRDSVKNILNLWVSDGTEEGTFSLPNTYVPTMEGFERLPYALVSSVTVNEKVYFQNFTDKLIRESELWVTDGTVAGTIPVIDNDSFYVTPSVYHPQPLIYFRKKIFLSANTREIGTEPYYIDLCLCDESADQTITGNLYPNPASGKIILEIQVPGTLSTDYGNLLIFDASGRRIITKAFSINENCIQISFDVSHLSQGVYFATVLVENKRFVQRFVVNR